VCLVHKCKGLYACMFRVFRLIGPDGKHIVEFATVVCLRFLELYFPPSVLARSNTLSYIVHLIFSSFFFLSNHTHMCLYAGLAVAAMHKSKQGISIVIKC
jgi:hypothetical protein